MNFSEALVAIWEGKKLSRAQWKNANYVFLVPGSEFEVNRPPLNAMFEEGTKVTYRPHIDMVGSDGLIGTWQPSSVDIFATDWSVVE